MQHRSLRWESKWTAPFFYVSWFICATWYAIVAGHTMAKLDTGHKQDLLDKMKGDDKT